MTRHYDADGTPLRRDRDGDLVPDLDALGTVPRHRPDVLCADHGNEGLAAHNCRVCWSEIKGGDRPAYFLGRAYANRSLTP